MLVATRVADTSVESLISESGQGGRERERERDCGSFESLGRLDELETRVSCPSGRPPSPLSWLGLVALGSGTVQ